MPFVLSFPHYFVPKDRLPYLGNSNKSVSYRFENYFINKTIKIIFLILLFLLKCLLGAYIRFRM